MKIPCVCDKGWHSLTANEMVDVIGAFQRGELSKVRYRKGIVTGVFSLCVLYAVTENTVEFTGACLAETPEGSVCKLPRGHREGRHGHRGTTSPARP